MIYTNAIDISMEEFRSLLDATRSDILGNLTEYGVNKDISGGRFEQIVFDSTVKVAVGTKFDGKMVHTADREFPDIVAAGFYGIEVKKTEKDGWTSIGNSVLETSRVDGVEKIYMFFGKLGGTPDIKFRNYDECLREIVVTHYPRYQIDMELPDGASIFDKMDTPYDTLRRLENPIKVIRKYYKSQLEEGDALWWIDDEVEHLPELSPIIRNFSSISADEKDAVVASVMAFFPEIFSNSSRKYERVPAFLASQYGLVSASLRDLFSAGGQVEVPDGVGGVVRVPQIVERVRRLAPLIQEQLQGKTKEELENLWGHKIEDNTDNPETLWCCEVDRQFHNSECPDIVSFCYKRGVTS